MPELWKTSIEIWTNYDPTDADLEDLGVDVASGNALIGSHRAIQIDSQNAAVPEEVRSFFTIGEVD